MRKIRRTVIALSILAALAVTAAAQNKLTGTSAAPQEKSLYDRLGGLAAITAVVDDFIGRAATDDRIKAKFAKTSVPRLRLHLIEQICAATGGPCKYTGLSMKKAHKGMKVTAGEFGALVEDLVAALDKFNVPAKEKNDLLGALGPMKADIVEDPSTGTGTPLPTTFKPAKPLSEERIKAGPAKKG
jgi:hemoglobin